MSSIDDLVVAVLDAMPTQDLRLVPVICDSTAPFRVRISGAATAVDAVTIAGTTAFGLGDSGYAFWAPGSTPPICFRTT